MPRASEQIPTVGSEETRIAELCVGYAQRNPEGRSARTLARLVYGMIYMAAGLLLLALGLGGFYYVWLGISAPPPLSVWAAQGFYGVVAGTVVVVGIVVCGGVGCAALVWCARCVERACRGPGVG